MKYFSKKVEYNGIKFDSIIERDYYIKLKNLEKSGIITSLELQKVFVTLPKILRQETVQLKTKTKVVTRVDEKETKYHADFYYYDTRFNKWFIVEVKSKQTAKIRDYTLRRKLVKLMVKRMNDDAGMELFVFKEIIK